jgi:hypothetical protein
MLACIVTNNRENGRLTEKENFGNLIEGNYHPLVSGIQDGSILLCPRYDFAGSNQGNLDNTITPWSCRKMCRICTW